MSNYQANIITKNPATPTGPNANGSAPGIWRMNEVAYWIKQGVWPNASILPDTYFPYVSLLLSSTSLGNANNNLFVDSSGAFNPISRNGNATQGSATPYSANWSNYFASSSDYLQISGPATGTGTWTVEGWFYFTSFPGGPIFAQGTADTTSCWFLYLTSSGGLNFYSNGDISSSSAGVVSLNTWVHIALVSNASTAKTYVNGVSVATGSYAGKVFTGGPFQLNRGYGGATSGNPCYQSNVRMVVGTAVYTANFTPPTSALTAISGTALLTCQSNRFRDASTNNYSVTRSGNVNVTDFAPFSPGNPGITYNQSDITNWSGYFDGSGDYLQMPSNAAFAFGTGDYTIEGWIYVTVGGVDQRITWFSDDRHNIDINTSNQIFLYDGSIRTFGTVTVGTWNHFAVSRTSGTVSCYLNGVRGYNASETTNSSTRSMNIAANNAGNGYFNGYISNIRVVKGTGVYSGATITVPTTPLTAISGTSLLTLQNAAFTDNSTNNFVITINGNTTVTGNSPFNTVGYWSNYFDGSGDWLSVPDNAALQMGNSDFTYECWLYPTSIPNTYQSFIEKRGVGGYAGVLLAIKSSGKYSILVASSSSSWGIVDESSIDVTLNAWQHLAVVRSGSTFSVYLNGVRLINTTISFSVFDNTSVQGIGAGDSSGNQPFYGYLSNVRIVKGTAVYSGASFTPPTAPLTAISGTSLLTCQNGRFIDNSTNAFTITRNGDVSVQSFDPFYTSTIASNGGSMYFDGSGDYLALQNNPSYALGPGDFTLEVWVYPIVQGGHGSSNNDCIIDFRPAANGAYGTLYSVNNGTSINWYANTGVRITGSAIPNGAWSHLCVSRVSGSTRLFINGVQSGSTYTDSTNYLQTNPWIGQFNDGVGSGWFQGYMSGMRIVKGTGVSSTFTPPTSPANPTPATTLLVNGMNAGIYDATAINDMETVGNAQVSTAVSKFGGSSVYFDGTGDYLAIPTGPQLYFGTSDFTVEAWIYPTGGSGNRAIFSGGAVNAMAFYINTSGKIAVAKSGVVEIIASTTTISTSTFTHVAATRSGNTFRIFVNGTLEATVTSSQDFTSFSDNRVGFEAGSSAYLGYIDDLRVTRGVARYTSNFTAPTQAFPTY